VADRARVTRLLALVLALVVLGGCGSSSGGGDTQPARQYKPNSNQNPDYEAR
jgi:hypothetical protein